MRLVRIVGPLCLIFFGPFLTAQSATHDRPSPMAQPSSADSPAPDPLGEAKALFRKGDLDAALQKYQQLLQERPKSPDAWAGIVRVYLNKKDVQSASDTVTKALTITDAWPVHIALGEVYFRQGRISDAEKEWVDVLNAGHHNARAYLGLARVRRALSMNESARLMVEKANELDSADPDIRLWSAILARPDRIPRIEDSVAGGPGGEAQPGPPVLQKEAACTLVSKVNSADIRMTRMLIDPEHLRGYGLPVAVDGQGSTLLLDTGADGILISRQIAEKAGLKKLRETTVQGFGDRGGTAAYIARAHSVRVGGLEFQDCVVVVAESRSVLGRDGLIGADMFEQFLVEIDFPFETLHLRELPKRPSETDRLGSAGGRDGSSENRKPDDTSNSGTADRSEGLQDRYIAPEMKSFTPVYRFGHALLVPTKVGDTPPKLFVLDTGSVDNLISLAAAREVTKVSGESDWREKGLSGSVNKLYSANKAILQFGHLRQENQDTLAFDFTGMSDGYGTEVSGCLGFTLLRMLDIQIDYRDGLVDFSYDPKRLIHF